MNVDEWIEYIMVSDKKVALPIMTPPGILVHRFSLVRMKYPML